VNSFGYLLPFITNVSIPSRTVSSIIKRGKREREEKRERKTETDFWPMWIPWTMKHLLGHYRAMLLLSGQMQPTHGRPGDIRATPLAH
jgi:hypothetical protein